MSSTPHYSLSPRGSDGTSPPHDGSASPVQPEASHEAGMARPREVKTHVTFPIADSQGNIVTAERRKGDRRHFDHTTHFPLKTEDGHEINSNRRRRVDRRIHNTQVVQDPQGAQLPKIVLDTGTVLCELTEDMEPITLGRDPRCTIITEASFTSRHHARILCEGGQFFVEDSSTNGTFVRPDGGREKMAHKGRLPLTGHGVIRLGNRTDDEDEALLIYTVIDTL